MEDSFNDYPAAAKKNAQQAIDWKEKYGRDEVDAGTAVGWQRAHQLAKGEKISADTVKRMASFNRHRKNSSIAPEHKDEPWKDRGYVSWLIWGGDEGVDWAMKKSKEIDDMKSESRQLKHIKLFEQFISVNESVSKYDYDKWVKANGKIKYPKWIEKTRKEIIKAGMMDKVYDGEHHNMSIWTNSLGDKLFKIYADKKLRDREFGKEGSQFLNDKWNDIRGYTAIFWEGAMIALGLSKMVEDMIANDEPVEPAYYIAKEWFNNHGKDTNRSRLFNAAVEKLEKWMKDNKIDTL